MIKIKQKENETRKEYLVRLAVRYIEDHTGIVGMDDSLFYDDAECDGYCLAEDLKIEFNIDDDYEDL